MTDLQAKKLTLKRWMPLIELECPECGGAGLLFYAGHYSRCLSCLGTGVSKWLFGTGYLASYNSTHS